MQYLSLNPGACKTWLLSCERSKEAVLVDPVADHVPAYLEALRERGLKLVKVIDTHTHADHLSGATLVAETLGVPYAMHHATSVRTALERLKDGDAVTFGDARLRVVHTPGHTKDSISLVGPEVLLTGDFLFLGEGGAGRTDLLGGDPGEHWDSLQRLRGFPDELTVLPGHDYRGNTTGKLGIERRNNPRLAQKRREDYVRWLSSMQLEPADWMLGVLKANAAGAKDRRGLYIPEGGACCEVGGGAAMTNLDFTVAAGDLASVLDQTPRDFVVLDVREPFEYTGPLGHVPGALNLPVSTITSRLHELLPLKDRKIYVICLSGGRSARATEWLRDNGFEHALNVAGGMKAWTMSGFPQEFGQSPALRT